MGAGRPNKPTQLKVLQGNPGKRPLPKNEPRPPEGEVKTPPWLHGKARTAWRWIAPILDRMGLLTTADPHALALLCEAYAEYIQAREIVRKLGMTYESRIFRATTKRVTIEETDEADDPESGWSIMIRPRPEVAIAADAWRRAHRMLVEFGMTPSSRAKVSVNPAEEWDPFEEYLKHGSN